MVGTTKTRLAVMTIGAVLVCFARPDWVAAAGLDVWNLPDLEQAIAAAAARSIDLEEAEDAVDHRIEAKDRMVRDLLDGRATLAAVTDAFLSMNRDRPETMSLVRAAAPGAADDREATAHNVLGYADLTPHPSAARKAESLRRLRGEFAALFPASARR